MTIIEMNLEISGLHSRRLQLESEHLEAQQHLSRAKSSLISGAASVADVSKAQADEAALSAALVTIDGQISAKETELATVVQAQKLAAAEAEMRECAKEASETLQVHDEAFRRGCELLAPQIETLLDSREKLALLRRRFESLQYEHPGADAEVDLSAIKIDWRYHRFDFDLPCAHGVYSAFERAGNGRAREEQQAFQKKIARSPQNSIPLKIIFKEDGDEIPREERKRSDVYPDGVRAINELDIQLGAEMTLRKQESQDAYFERQRNR